MDDFLKPISETLIDEINAVETGKAVFPSKRLPPSKLGHVCHAYVWHTFRWSALITKNPKHARTAEAGKEDERRVIARLRAAGWKITDFVDGAQIRVETYNGHIVSEVEGVGRHPVHFKNQDVLLEVKSMKRSRFNPVKSGKPLSVVEPQHYAQIVYYMDKLKLPYCVYIAYCRDDGELFCHIIPANKVEARRLDELATSIIRSKIPLAKISTNATNHICKQCEMIEPCQFRAAPPKSCHSCFHGVASETDKGRWHCELACASIPPAVVLEGCELYQRII